MSDLFTQNTSEGISWFTHCSGTVFKLAQSSGRKMLQPLENVWNLSDSPQYRIIEWYQSRSDLLAYIMECRYGQYVPDSCAFNVGPTHACELVRAASAIGCMREA
jgi:hypothetical protein